MLPIPAMRIAAAAIALAALALPLGCGEDEGTTATSSPSAAGWALGDWTGELRQSGMAPFRVWAEVRSLAEASPNRVRYSGLECRGSWVPLGGDARVQRFRERITTGRSDACKGVGLVTLERRGNRVAYRFRGGGVESRGVLRRDGEGSPEPSGAYEGDAGEGPEPERDAMAQTTDVRGAPGRELVLSRVAVPPGASLPLHRHRGTQVARIESGTLTYSVRTGSVVVRSGESDQSPRAVRTIRAGGTGPIRAGEWIVEQPSEVHRAENRGEQPVVIYIATLLESGAPPATPIGG